MASAPPSMPLSQSLWPVTEGFWRPAPGGSLGSRQLSSRGTVTQVRLEKYREFWLTHFSWQPP